MQPDVREQDVVRTMAVAPGSRQEAEALARLDAQRAQDRATYEPGRRSGWDARAGSPRHGLTLDVEGIS